MAERREATLGDFVRARREAESLVLTRRRDVSWLDERDREFAIHSEAVKARIAALPAVPDDAGINAAWAVMRAAREGIADMADEDVGELLARVGIAVVGEAGVSIRYAGPFAALIVEPVMVDPRARKN